MRRAHGYSRARSQSSVRGGRKGESGIGAALGIQLVQSMWSMKLERLDHRAQPFHESQAIKAPAIVTTPIKKPQIVLVRRHHGRSSGAGSVTVAEPDPLDCAAVMFTLAPLGSLRMTLTTF